MSGIGFSRIGLDPLGFRSNDASVGVRANNAAMCRAIDPTTNDYVDSLTDTAADFASMSIIAAKVLMALGNKVGSFAWDADLGDPTLSIDRDDGKLPQRALAYARAQLKPFIDAGEVELVSVTVVVVDGAWSRTVVWKDVSTDREHRITT